MTAFWVQINTAVCLSSLKLRVLFSESFALLNAGVKADDEEEIL